MTEWIDVPVADVAVGDEVKVDGYGKRDYDIIHTFSGHVYYPVTGIEGPDIVVDWMQGSPGPVRLVRVRRSSIVGLPRRKTKPKPGEWQSMHDGLWGRCECHGNDRRSDSSFPHRVYRASGWSNDTRTRGERRRKA